MPCRAPKFSAAKSATQHRTLNKVTSYSIHVYKSLRFDRFLELWVWDACAQNQAWNRKFTYRSFIPIQNFLLCKGLYTIYKVNVTIICDAWSSSRPWRWWWWPTTGFLWVENQRLKRQAQCVRSANWVTCTRHGTEQKITPSYTSLILHQKNCKLVSLAR